MYYQEAPENSDTLLDQEDKLQELEESLELSNDDPTNTRMMANSYLSDLFRNALNSPEQLDRVHLILSKLSEHPDSGLRLVLMKMLPRLALLCCGGNRLDYVNTQLWPLLLSCLPDKNEEVRKTSELSLLVLMKGKLLYQETLEEQVCPFIVEISKVDGYANTVAGKTPPRNDVEELQLPERHGKCPPCCCCCWFCWCFSCRCCQESPALMSRKLLELSSVCGEESLPQPTPLEEREDQAIWRSQSDCEMYLDSYHSHFDDLDVVEHRPERGDPLPPPREHPSGDQTLMGKMAPLIGKEATEKHFLDRFVHLCSNEKAIVREMCAKSLGDMCTVLGTETTENCLLPLFVQLSRDAYWDVRLACAEASVSVSCSCTLATRKTVLAAIFTDFLMDADQFVRMTAFGFLGAFICTFADPSVTKLDYDEDGKLIFVGQDGCEFRMPSVQFNYSGDLESIENIRDVKPFPGEPKGFDQTLNISNALRFIVENGSNHFNFSGLNSNQRFLKMYDQSWTSTETETENVAGGDSDEADDSFNTFRFWRTPLPTLKSLDLEPEQDEIRTNLNILDNELSSLSEKLAECSSGDLEEMKTESVISSSSSPDSGWNSAETTPHVESAPPPDAKTGDDSRGTAAETETSNEASEPNLPSQEIVPQLLLDYFVSMTVPLDAMEKEIAQDCAYSLPAVALTLGPSNWPYIKNAYKCLSMNFKWRVRRTVVSSIHKLASILGEEIASKDLAPIFESFIRDLDEVKIGALEHLADFLKLVKPETRNSFLPRLKQFLETDFDWNWRYRKEFGQQLGLLIDLFSPADCLEYFEPLTTLLLCDKVAAVRHKAVLLFLDLLVNLSRERDFQEKLLYVLVKKFAEHSSWRRRQIFVLVCSEIAKRNALTGEHFCGTLLDRLLALGQDPVPNVCLAVARCLSADVLSTGYIGPSSPRHSAVVDALDKLKNHSDADVRYFASLHEDAKDKNDSNAPLPEDLKLET